MKKYFFIFTVFTLLLFSNVNAEWSAGLGWPYISARYGFSPSIALEARVSSMENITVVALRGSWSINNFRDINFKPFIGLEGGYISFNSLDIKGSGLEGSVFLGTEYFITKQISLAADIGPMLIGLNSDKVSSSGLEWLVNAGIYYYFI